MTPPQVSAVVPGLSIPVLSALKNSQEIDHESQARLLEWIWQKGQGANVAFSAGTTGEWNHLPASVVRQLNEACFEHLKAKESRPAFWAGVTALNAEETLANLKHALKLGADASVLAPLSIAGVAEPIPFFHQQIIPLFERLGKRLPICLYDNADIAQKGGEQHLHTRDVKQLSRLDFVVGIKVSAGAKVVGNYLKAARHFKQRHEFGVYLGNASLCFSVFEVPRGLRGFASHFWNRIWLRKELPIGVVAGPANLFPREWQRAWRACLGGEEALMEAYERLFEKLSKAWRFEENGKQISKSLACMKAALQEEGILNSDALAQGTPVLSAEQKKQWLERYQAIKQELAKISPAGWISTRN